MSHTRCMEATDARTALQNHDASYMMSDALEASRRGRLQVAHICELLDALEPAEVAALADEFFVHPIDSFIAMRFIDAQKHIEGRAA